MISSVRNKHFPFALKLPIFGYLLGTIRFLEKGDIGLLFFDPRKNSHSDQFKGTFAVIVVYRYEFFPLS